jgi:hypothetical protein
LQSIDISLQKAAQILGPQPNAEAIEKMMREHFRGFTLVPEFKDAIIRRRPLSRTLFGNITANALGLMIANNTQIYWQNSAHTNQPSWLLPSCERRKISRLLRQRRLWQETESGHRRKERPAVIAFHVSSIAALAVFHRPALVASRVVCKLKGPLTPVLIEVVEHRKNNSLQALSMSHHTHRSSSSSHFTKSSFD